MKKLLILLALFSFVLSACSTANVVEVGTSGVIVAETELFHDFGDINIEGGLIDHSFSFVNDSDEDLMIMNLSTSCGCTAARVILADGMSSPTFGMHDSRQWNQWLGAGESFEVLVTYDPMAHGPDATGEMNRSIIMTTSSHENGRGAVLDPSTGYSFTQINIKGMVLSEESYLNLNSLEDEV